MLPNGKCDYLKEDREAHLGKSILHFLVKKVILINVVTTSLSLIMLVINELQ